jgi:hypothetical protein
MSTHPQDHALPQAEPVATNPHVLWRQVLGFALWTGPLSLIASGPIGAALCLALGGVTFADAWVSGIYKRPSSKSFINISPMSWGIVMALLFIVAYPTYLVSRNKLRTIDRGNGHFIATIVIGAVLIVLLLLNLFSTSQAVALSGLGHR